MTIIGKIHTLSVTRSGGAGAAVITLNRFEVADFSYESGFTTTTTVTKNDLVDYLAGDQYTIKIAYPTSSVPASSTTLANLVTTATNAINAAFPTDLA